MATKQWMNLALFGLTGSLCLAAQNPTTQNYNNSPNPNKPNNGSMQTTPGQQSKPMTPKLDCSQLTPDEQDFATQLSPAQKMMFCNKFDTDMRSKAIDMSGQMGDNGVLMTNDQAVEQVARDNNMPMPMAPPRKGGSCPSK